MGSTQCIWEDLLEDTAFGLFAIHSQLEDYTLAFELNRACGLRLSRLPDDLLVGQHGALPVFRWKDVAHHQDWTLLANTARMEEASTSADLFGGTPTRRRYHLIPEKKEVDYFLKVEGGEPESSILQGMLAIPKVITAYRLDADLLKSKHNLIF